MFIFFAALNVWLAFTAPQDLHFRHLSCMHVLVLVSAGIERWKIFRDREIYKYIVALKKTFTDSLCSGRLSDTSNCFLLLQTLIPWSLPCLYCVSGIHRERNHGSTRSTRPITVYGRTAVCKSQLGTIIENPVTRRGAEQAFGCWFADGLYRGLVCLQCRLGLEREERVL